VPDWFVTSVADEQATSESDGPCAILMTGARGEEHTVHDPVSELAARYDGSASEDTSSPREAYADWEREYEPAEWAWPLG
jgi:hypothetical protein